MLLHLLRHAHAGDPEAWGGPDADRPLSDKGRAQADRLGAHLVRIGFRPDAIIASPKARALETAEIVADHLGVSVTEDERLGRMFGADDVAALIDDAGGPQRPVLVGHDPDFSDLLSSLCGSPIPMRKGAIARIDVPPSMAPGSGTLRWLIPPDALG
jgi:phosphohistidine phosphatase